MATIAPPADRKTHRFEARLDEQTAELLTEAAAASGTNLTAFVVGAARERAEQVLARSDVTVISPDQFAALLDALDRPARVIPGLRRIAEQPRQFERV